MDVFSTTSSAISRITANNVMADHRIVHQAVQDSTVIVVGMDLIHERVGSTETLIVDMQTHTVGRTTLVVLAARNLVVTLGDREQHPKANSKRQAGHHGTVTCLIWGYYIFYVEQMKK
ncbi:expressed unknown protein [Seminavis robusta]|uniref:Uncharacterized protein n=1 Tax=Seminavis robusta TaxID=568900 RepID=A0A9N8E0M0_9STRA|nr:expressed unknown protein [Seminavis robusta]|eukprot:Sro501_g155471.1  (118) ;mRNA; f:31777-32130